MRKIFIISDNVIFRKGIIRIISDQKEFSVTGEASCMKDLWPDFEKELPHMIILDMMLPKNQILPISKKLHIRFPNIPCLLISADNIEYIFLECLIRGTFGFLWKESSPDELITAIQTIFQGENYFRIPE